MGKVMAGMTVSLDGFMDAGKVSPDFEELLQTASFKEMAENTGAVIMGNNTYHMADPMQWVNDDYEFQVPLFILTHDVTQPVPKGNDKLSVTYITDGIERAIIKAKEAAGEKMVQIIGGAVTIQQALNSGLCDELQIDIMPLLLGKGLKLLENLDTDKIKLERISVAEITPMRTSIMFKLTKIQ
ncbi:MAG: dihydrofolate reductase [Candidatus Saccharibacteria bacterium]|nr:dihydrofolate reductase [Candidatus Saccharibacteria bacterium]